MTENDDKAGWSEADFLMDAGATKAHAYGDYSKEGDEVQAELEQQRKELGHVIERLFIYGCPQPNYEEVLGRGELMAHYIINAGFQKVQDEALRKTTTCPHEMYGDGTNYWCQLCGHPEVIDE